MITDIEFEAELMGVADLLKESSTGSCTTPALSDTRARRVRG